MVVAHSARIHSGSASTHSAVAVRPATARDKAAVLRMECACFGQARLLWGLWPRTGSRDAHTWVAEVDGAPAGYLIAYFKKFNGCEHLYVGGVGVRAQFRNRGAGSALMQAALGGQPALWLHVRASNDAAIAVYRKLGMVELQRLSRFYSNGDDALILGTPALA